MSLSATGTTIIELRLNPKGTSEASRDKSTSEVAIAELAATMSSTSERSTSSGGRRNPQEE